MGCRYHRRSLGIDPTKLLLVTALLFWIIQASAGIEWLAVGKWNNYWNRTSECKRKTTKGFVKIHRQICKRNLEMMPVVAAAARETVLVCEELFSDSRWNCSSIELAPNFAGDLKGGSRELALVNTLSSAALMHSVAKACALGVTSKCGCGRIPNEPPPGNFKWGGCGDDIDYGTVFSQTFADAPFDNKRKKLFDAAKHNNALGRKIVEDSLTSACKCHGVSGSCTIKTCWKALPDIRTIGQAIKHAYHRAVDVKYRRSKQNRAERYFVVKYGNVKKITDDQMIYTEKSPDYCLPDPTKGSPGTKGRVCDKESTGSGGCQSMCCGRGFTSEMVEEKYRCDCKYYWCCYVKCKTCYRTVEVNRCR